MKTDITQAIIANLLADEYDCGAARDLLVNIILQNPELEKKYATPKINLSDETVTTFIRSFERSELLEIEKWGMGDTCVRDSIYERIERTGLDQSVIQLLDASKQQG